MLRRAPTRVEIKNDDLEELAAAARLRGPALNPLQESPEVGIFEQPSSHGSQPES
jgi:hypothetical protein